jgi:hypothetical protein
VTLQVSDDTLTSIFGTILDWHLNTQGFPNAIKALSKDLVAATLAVYSTAASKLLPTPSKSHYLFNLRDFARVVQVSHDAPSRWHHLCLISCIAPMQLTCRHMSK